MNPRHFLLARLALVVCAARVTAGAAELATSAWVHSGADGRLVYQTTPAGDRIMDFSHAGYMGGGVALPDVPVRVTVRPSRGADDTAAIQAAIDQVAALPLRDGFRGAVLLAPGTFTCATPIVLSADGVVLRGSGASGESASTIKLSGKPHLAINVHAPGGRRGQGVAGRNDAGGVQTPVSDAYVPSGAISLAVADAAGFAVGDTIAIQKPVTAAWVKFMHMDDLTRDGKPQTWIRAGTTLATERRIVAIAAKTLTLDVPLSDSFDARYLNPPGTVVVKIPPLILVKQVGIEHLHIESPLQEISHTEPHFTALRIMGEDCWACDVAIDETMNSVATSGRRITLERVSVHRQAKHQGASKPAEFAPDAGQVLLDRCSVTADNVWFIATGAGQAGPIVILNCDFHGASRSEAHQRWSTGMLYDNCRAPDGGIEMRNRGSMGSGHGWPMAWGVIWNCVAQDYLVQNPPGAVNWVIGSIGRSEASPRPFGTGPNLPEGIFDSPNHPVAPQSLYLAQLAERLGPQALKNIGYGSTRVDSALDKPAGPRNRPGSPAASNADAMLGPDLAIDRPVLTSNRRGDRRDFAGWQALDGNDQTCWATDDGVVPATLELDTEGAVEINTIAIGEATGTAGQVKRYKVEGFVDSAWRVLAEGGTIGERRVLRFPTLTVWKARLTILQAEPYAAIRTFGLFLAKN